MFFRHKTGSHKLKYKCQDSFSAANHRTLVGVFRLIQKNIRVMSKKNKYEDEDFFCSSRKKVETLKIKLQFEEFS